MTRADLDVKSHTHHINTLCVHGARGPDPATRAISPPIYQTSTFAFDTARQGAAIFAGEEEGYIYTRLGNPTHETLEEYIALLEGGEKGLAAASGLAATAIVAFTLMEPGDNFISSDTIYGGTMELFDVSFTRLGFEARRVSALDASNIETAIDDRTRFVFIETPANPTIRVIDITACAEICRKHNIPLVVDNTFATPVLQRPLELGADIILHSSTKYINGHGDAIGGLLVGSEEFITKAKKEPLKNIGGCTTPLNAWLNLRGLRTLAIRMERHSSNAMELAQYLSQHPKVDRVWYPGLPDYPEHEIAKRQMSAFGGMLAFELKGGRRAGEVVLDSVKVMVLAVSLGDCHTLIQHPASMTHCFYSAEELAAAGIAEGMIRMSVGIEDIHDLIEDMGRALEAI